MQTESTKMLLYQSNATCITSFYYHYTALYGTLSADTDMITCLQACTCIQYHVYNTEAYCNNIQNINYIKKKNNEPFQKKKDYFSYIRSVISYLEYADIFTTAQNIFLKSAQVSAFNTVMLKNEDVATVNLSVQYVFGKTGQLNCSITHTVFLSKVYVTAPKWDVVTDHLADYVIMYFKRYHIVYILSSSEKTDKSFRTLQLRVYTLQKHLLIYADN